MSEKVKRIYVDTSAVYGAPDRKFSQDSKRFWDAVRHGEIIILVSDVLEEEIERAPQRIRDIFYSLPESVIERIPASIESTRLATQYIDNNVVDESSFDDCRHVAIATVAHADGIVSWNLKHMVNRRDEYNTVNRGLDYPEIEIQTPSQFMEAHHDEP
jgi:predicted nucleic acid-binding protein